MATVADEFEDCYCPDCGTKIPITDLPEFVKCPNDKCSALWRVRYGLHEGRVFAKRMERRKPFH